MGFVKKYWDIIVTGVLSGLEGIVNVYTYAVSPPSWIKPGWFAFFAFITLGFGSIWRLIKAIKHDKNED